MKILIADDDDELRELMSQYLSFAGYSVSAHENGKKAWESLQRDGADMAILDINMPEMDGLELLDLIRGSDRFQEMPVILVTAGSKNIDRDSALGRGADDYITKPVDYDHLVKQIKIIWEAFGKE